jgi:lipopolysaccharide biosynthesis glycosyltransferase
LEDIVRIYIGFDPVESVAFHVCAESIIRNSSKPVSITPLYLPHFKDYKETHQGSNQFIHSRFLIPHLDNHNGFSIFMDGDMVVTGDIAELWEMRDPRMAVQVVKHDYTTKYPKKYLGASNVDYPCKNWSSVMIFNSGSMINRHLTPEYVMQASGKELHRFEWIEDRNRIGEIPNDWNWLVSEYPRNDRAKLYHWTIGTPCFEKDDVMDYKKQDHVLEWNKYYASAIYPMRTHPGMASDL